MLKTFPHLLTLAFSITLGLTRPLAAQGSRSFIIKGNERTQTSYITELSTNCMDAAALQNPTVSVDLSTFNQCLLNSKLFSDVKTSIDGSSITIEVAEKWTLIPAPFFSKSGGTTRGGVFLFESNFLGKGLTLGLGATLSNLGHSFFGIFSNPYLLGSQYFLAFSLREEKSIFELKSRERTVLSVLERNLGGAFSLGYHFPWFNLSGQLAHSDRSYFVHKAAIVPKDYPTTTLGTTLEYDKRDHKLYYSQGLFLRARYAQAIGPADDVERLSSTSYTLSWQQPAFADHALLLQASGLKLSGGRLTDGERVGSSKGFRGIETRTAWAEAYQTGTVEYQVPLRSFERGTLTTALFVDGGTIKNRGGGLGRVNYTASGLGLYFYLRQLAVPGIGIETGYNGEYEGRFVNVSLGFAL